MESQPSDQSGTSVKQDVLVWALRRANIRWYDLLLDNEKVGQARLVSEASMEADHIGEQLADLHNKKRHQ